MKTNSLDFDAQALREKILDLAMRGKLVPQDPNDEPASVLLEKIKAEKAELIKEKKIKKTKPLPPITDDEKPFDIPDSWEWVRLGDVAKKITDGTHNPPPNSHEGKQVISAINIKKGKIDFSLSDRFVSEEQFLKEDKRTHIRRGDILLTIVGSLGNAAIVDTDTLFTAQRSVAVIDSSTSSQFLYYALISSMFKNQILANAKGTTQKGIYLKKLTILELPIPPLLEQSRIAAKIAQLFALLRKVETSTQQYAKLQTLLKSKVLDLAMRGKLVKQDPNDEPASVLLEKIKVEKQELIKEKKIKKTKPLPPITDDEKPFDIPDSWEWVRLGEICEIKGGKRVPKGRKLEDQVSYKPYIRVADMQDHSVNTDTLKYASKDIFNEISRYTISSKDVYFSIAGTIGKVGSIPEKLDGSLLTENAAKLDFFAAQEMNKKFFIEMLSSDFIKEQHKKMLSKVAQPKLALIKLKKTIIPLPPLSEQKRVVRKILQIFSL